MVNKKHPIYGERIRFARLRRGRTQNELSKLIGFGKNTMSLFEMGQREPKISQICALADILEVNLDYLAGREPPPDWNEKKEENFC